MGMLEARPGDGTYVMASDRFAVAVSNRLKESELPQILEARLALERRLRGWPPLKGRRRI